MEMKEILKKLNKSKEFADPNTVNTVEETLSDAEWMKKKMEELNKQPTEGLESVTYTFKDGKTSEATPNPTTTKSYSFDAHNPKYQQGATLESLFGEKLFNVDGDTATPTGAFGTQVENILGNGVTGKTKVGHNDLYKLMGVFGDKGKLGPMADDPQLQGMGEILGELKEGLTGSYKDAYSKFVETSNEVSDTGISFGNLYEGVTGSSASDNMDGAKELGDLLGLDTSKDDWMDKTAPVGKTGDYRDNFGKMEKWASDQGISSDDINIDSKHINAEESKVLFRDMNTERLGREATEKANSEASGLLSKYMGGERTAETDDIFSAVTGRGNMDSEKLGRASQMQEDLNSVKGLIEDGKVTDKDAIDTYNKYKGMMDYESVDGNDGGYFKPKEMEQKAKEVLEFEDFGGIDKSIDINAAMDNSPTMAEGNSNLKDIYDAKKAGIDVGADGDKILERAYQLEKSGVGKGEKPYAEFQTATNNYNTDNIKIASSDELGGLDDLTGWAVNKSEGGYKLNDGFINEAGNLKDISKDEKALLGHKGPIQTQQQLDTLVGLEEKASKTYFDNNLERSYGKETDKALGEVMEEVKGLEGGIGKNGSSVEDIITGHLGIGKGENKGRVNHDDVSSVTEKIRGGAELGDLNSKEKSILGYMSGVGEKSNSTQDRMIGNMTEDVMDEIIGNQSHRYKSRGRTASLDHKKDIVTEILGLDTNGRDGAHQGYEIKLKNLKGKELEKAQKRLAEGKNFEEVVDLFDVSERKGMKGTYGNMRQVDRATSTQEGANAFAKDLDSAIDSARKGDVRTHNTRENIRDAVKTLGDSDSDVSDGILKSMEKFADGDDVLSLGKHVNKKTSNTIDSVKDFAKKITGKSPGKVGAAIGATVGVAAIGAMFSNASEERERKDQELAMMIGSKNGGGF